MRQSIRWSALAAAAAAVSALAGCGSMLPGKTGTSFFVTSSNPGKGGDLGGLAGADAHCQTLASAAGSGNRSWRAYLSTQPFAGQPGVNARDRIGNGPWRNAKGVVVASDVAQLHGANNLSKQTALTETGAVINGAGQLDLRQLDDGQRRRGDGGSPRQNRPGRERAGQILELVPPITRLQP